jgi:hypothetical protein
VLGRRNEDAVRLIPRLTRGVLGRRNEGAVRLIPRLTRGVLGRRNEGAVWVRPRNDAVRWGSAMKARCAGAYAIG